MEAYQTASTLHSIQRAKERCKYKNWRAAENSIRLALTRGKGADDYSSWESNYLRNEGRDRCTAIAYDNFCYIMNEDGRCVTVHALPVWFGKKKRFDGKERIRDYKKYCKSHTLIVEDDELIREINEFCGW